MKRNAERRHPRDLFRRALLVLPLLFSVSGCASLGFNFGSKGDSGVKIDSMRTPPVGTKVVNKKISRESYIKTLREGGAVNKVRLIEVFHRGAPPPYPEYRFFDVKPGSVYDLLGLATADILVAADGYVVPDAALFWSYLNLIAEADKAKIEINRHGVPMLFEYSFME